MDLNEWLNKYRSNFGSEYETLFAESVLPLVPELSFDSILVQYPFQDRDSRRRYCDFVIQEDDDVRIAIEIDGYDKRGSGMGMSHKEFVDWQRRQAALTSQGWYVLRFANRDVRDAPKRCAEHISLLLRRSRSSSQNRGLSEEENERLAALTNAQNKTIEHLNQETSVMKYAITAFTTLILALVMVIVWQSGASSSRQPQPSVQVAELPPPTQQVAADQAKHTPQPVNSQPAPQAVAVPLQTLKGTTCENPIGWHETGEYIGQVMTVVGPLVKVTTRENIRGNPTFIDIGAAYPNTRMTLVIWGDQKADFPMVKPGQLEGERVCIRGLLETYKGVPQIVLNSASQFKVL